MASKANAINRGSTAAGASHGATLAGTLDVNFRRVRKCCFASPTFGAPLVDRLSIRLVVPSVADNSADPCRYEPSLPHIPEPFPETETGWACNRCLFPVIAPTEKKQTTGDRQLISQEEYVKSFGQTCPRCGSERLSFSDSQNDFGVFLEMVDCDDCDLRFERVFELSGYNVIA